MKILRVILFLLFIWVSSPNAFAVPDGAGNDIFIGNVGIGTTTPQAQLAILNGNVGIGTWTAVGGALIVQGENVGIGTVNANQVLTVAGRIYNTSGGIQFPDNTVQVTASTGSGVVSSGTINQVAKYVATGTTVSGSGILFDDGTNVGIGTAVPSGKFQVNNNALPFYVDSNSNVGIGTAKTSAAALSVMNGNVGIGTWVPGNYLDVVGGNIGIGTAYNLGIGTSTVLTMRANISNIFVGWQAGSSVSTGNDTTAVGSYALTNFTSGTLNTAVGYSALSSQSTGDYSTAVGVYALANANANYNTAFGYYAAYNEQGSNNTAVGVNAMYGTGSAGSYNSAIGYDSLYAVSTGQNNVAMGTNAGYPKGANGTVGGSDNVWLGANTGPSGTSDVSNSVGIGSYATAGASNVMVLGGTGGNALNIGIGTDMNGASGSLIVNSGNVGIGTIKASSAALTVMNGNVGIGTWVPGNSLDVVNGNIGIGKAYNLVGIGTTSTILATHNDTTNIFVGWQSGATAAGNSNAAVGLGDQTVYSISTASGSTGVGYQACKSCAYSETDVGWNAGGAGAGFGLNASTHAYINYSPTVALGADALSSASLSSATDTAVGYNSLANDTSGGLNAALGYQSGYPNGANGTTTGNSNVWLGANAGPAGTSNVSNSVGIGSYATAGASNVMVLGGMGVNALNVGIGTDMNGASAALTVIGGNVGIGTITPQAALVVTNGNLGIGTWTAAGGNLIVNGGGNVGIGSASPQAELDLGTSATPLTMPGLKANSGTRFLCINTAGVITSSTTACSGT